ncbi:MAG: hypothetical protein ACR2GF_00730 [Acidimicrobiales bacterium]
MLVERLRLRIGDLAKAGLVSGQAYRDPKDALNEFVSNAADEYVEAGRRGERIGVMLRRKGRYPVIAVDDVGRGMSPERLREIARNLFEFGSQLVRVGQGALYVPPPDSRRRRHVAVVGRAGTTIVDDIAEIEEFALPPWDIGQVTGDVMFAALRSWRISTTRCARRSATNQERADCSRNEMAEARRTRPTGRAARTRRPASPNCRSSRMRAVRRAMLYPARPGPTGDDPPSVHPDPHPGEARSRFEAETGIVFYNDRHEDYLVVWDDEAGLLDYLATLVAMEYVLYNNPRAANEDLAFRRSCRRS